MGTDFEQMLLRSIASDHWKNKSRKRKRPLTIEIKTLEEELMGKVNQESFYWITKKDLWIPNLILHRPPSLQNEKIWVWHKRYCRGQSLWLAGRNSPADDPLISPKWKTQGFPPPAWESHQTGATWRFFLQPPRTNQRSRATVGHKRTPQVSPSSTAFSATGRQWSLMWVSLKMKDRCWVRVLAFPQLTISTHLN